MKVQYSTQAHLICFVPLWETHLHVACLLLAGLISIFTVPLDIDYKYHTCATFLSTRIHTLKLDGSIASCCRCRGWEERSRWMICPPLIVNYCHYMFFFLWSVEFSRGVNDIQCENWEDPNFRHSVCNRCSVFSLCSNTNPSTFRTFSFSWTSPAQRILTFNPVWNRYQYWILNQLIINMNI